jgi:hypothetical protein
MKLPDSIEVRNAFSSVETNFDSLISFVSTEKSPTFSEYHSRLQSVVMELAQIFGERALSPNCFVLAEKEAFGVGKGMK